MCPDLGDCYSHLSVCPSPQVHCRWGALAGCHSAPLAYCHTHACLEKTEGFPTHGAEPSRFIINLQPPYELGVVFLTS